MLRQHVARYASRAQAAARRGLLAGRLVQGRAAAKLTCPAIVRVFDVGQTALGDPFIGMELLSSKNDCRTSYEHR